MKHFNKEKVYDNEISPLIKEIVAICEKNEMPMIASFAYENCPEKGVGCCTTFINDIDGMRVDNFVRANAEIRRTSIGFIPSIIIK